VHFMLFALNTAVERLVLLLCIPEVPGSNIGSETHHSEFLSAVPVVKCWDFTLKQAVTCFKVQTSYSVIDKA
jgi:hypothetical protein